MALLNKIIGLPLRQEEVDFLIPDVHQDRRLGIDPFLFYRSSNPHFKQAHGNLISFFATIIALIKNGATEEALQFLEFPEPNEICLGYTAVGIGGSGVGQELGNEILTVLNSSPALLSRGLKHVEELQLICSGIGPDRISDICANVLKKFLVEYTQIQCHSWNIPLQTSVPVNHFFDFETKAWRDDYFDLPVNPAKGGPLLLVPRRVLRILPWINYEEYATEYRNYFLKHIGGRRKKQLTFNRTEATGPLLKDHVCEVTRADTKSMDLYVEKKERNANQAQPHEIAIMKDLSNLRGEAGQLQKDLASILSGREDAYEYQDIAHRILTFCLHPHIVDGKPQQRTIEGTLIRDLIFSNEGTLNFWRYIQATYLSLFVVVELKNKTVTSGTDVDQLASYLGDPLGRFGILLSRHGKEHSFNRRKAVYNKDAYRKVILHLCDDDLVNLLQIRGDGKDPTSYVQNLYREFMTKLE